MKRTTTHWPAPAKINLFLHITGRRANGYHDLQTAFQFLALADDIALTVRDDDAVRLLNPMDDVPAESDLTVRAARLLKPHTACRSGVEIEVNKRIPMGGGLGGGSSDAATVLLALNQLWALSLGIDELAELGLGLGADVPVFVRGSAAWAEGVGEELTPMDAIESALVVVNPRVAVDTGRVFQAPDLTRNTAPITMHALSLPDTSNDCQAITCSLYPEVAQALDWLGRFAPARMSGTGASVFGPSARPRHEWQNAPLFHHA